MATIAMRAEQKGLVAPEREALIKSEIAANKKAGYMAAAKKIVAERGTTNTDDLGSKFNQRRGGVERPRHFT
jgi:hypothetical protein